MFDVIIYQMFLEIRSSHVLFHHKAFIYIYIYLVIRSYSLRWGVIVYPDILLSCHYASIKYINPDVFIIHIVYFKNGFLVNAAFVSKVTFVRCSKETCAFELTRTNFFFRFKKKIIMIEYIFLIFLIFCDYCIS